MENLKKRATSNRPSEVGVVAVAAAFPRIIDRCVTDLEQANQDCEDFRECLLKYELMESDIMRLYDRETSSKEINDMFNSISLNLVSDPSSVPA